MRRWVLGKGVTGALVAGLATAFMSAAAEPPAPALASRLREIEGAFRSGSASRLRASLAPGKVRADLPELAGGSGSYGSGQLEVIFGRVFDEQRTRGFTFRDEDVTATTPGTAFARAKWTRRPRAGGPETVETLTFTLREGGGEWRVHEIRSSR